MAGKWYSSRIHLVVLACLVATLVVREHLIAAGPGQSIIPVLRERLGLSELQARGAAGALLVYVRERLPKPEFDELAQTIPNAERIMEEVKLRGVVTRPLDNLDAYEAALANLGIGQPLASRVAPAVVQALAETGHLRERDILARALD
jgi:hypothetical protein